MSETAFKTQYRDETIAQFERMQSVLRSTVVTEAVVNGNEATFLVSGSGGSEAVTRGVNGLIPARGDNNEQYTAVLKEWHDLVRKTQFNIFASQGDQRALMQRTTLGTINRRIDKDIIDLLATGTRNTGAAAQLGETLALRAKTALQNADVPWDNNIFALITPAAEAYLMQLDSFASADYVSDRPMESAPLAWDDRVKFKRWIGINWLVHPGLPGKGTASAKCFMYHKNAIGHAANSGGMMTGVGYDEEQDYSYSRASMYLGGTVLQNSGIIVINHDDSAFAIA